MTRWHSVDNQSVRSSVPVVSIWLSSGNRTFLEVASMVDTWWIVAVLSSNTCSSMQNHESIYDLNIDPRNRSEKSRKKVCKHLLGTLLVVDSEWHYWFSNKKTVSKFLIYMHSWWPNVSWLFLLCIKLFVCMYFFSFLHLDHFVFPGSRLCKEHSQRKKKTLSTR